MVFYALLKTAFSSLFYGILLTMLIMVVLYFVLRSADKRITESVTYYITGIVLSVLLVIQSTLLIGAVKAKNTAEVAEVFLVQKLGEYSEVADTYSSQYISDFFSSYIWHRVWWMLGLIVVGVIIVLFFGKNKAGRRTSYNFNVENDFDELSL